MNKIVSIALEAKGFKQEVIEAVIKITNETGNPEAALEMLLGIYEVPKLPIKAGIKGGAELISFNPLSNPNYAIKYAYAEEKTRCIQWKKGSMTEAEAIAKFRENPKEWVNCEQDYSYKHVGIAEFVEKTDTTSVERWLEAQ